jgi:hypothetical protein
MVMRRQLRRGQDRGTALFVVVLAITLITGIGLYTVHSSALMARASGSEREALQTSYVAQLGTLATLTWVSRSAAALIAQSRPKPPAPPDTCRGNLGLDATKFTVSCLKGMPGHMPLSTPNPYFDADSFDPPSGAHAITGNFTTEMTDVYSLQTPVAGMRVTGSGTGGFWQATFTTTSDFEPVASSAACVQNLQVVAGQHMTRAHVRIGPVTGL